MVSVGPVEVDEISLADLCRRYQVRELALFGSAARGESRADSDIDLLVEFLPQAHIGLMDYAGLMLDLSKLLGRKVDLVSKNGNNIPDIPTIRRIAPDDQGIRTRWEENVNLNRGK